MASELEDFEKFNPMAEDYVKKLNSMYFGGPGFALPDTRDGAGEPFNILVEHIPSGLEREGLVRAFKNVGVSPINCKLIKSNSGSSKAILQVKSITEATTALEALNGTKPLNLRVSLAASKEDFERKKEEIQREQHLELARHLRVLSCNTEIKMESISDMFAVECLFKLLPHAKHNCFACEAEPLVRHVHFIASEEKVIDPFEGLPENVPVSCAFCSSQDGKFVICSQCRVAVYCGLRCQSLAWTKHRNVCATYSRTRNGDRVNDSHVHESSNSVEAMPKPAPTKVDPVEPKPVPTKVVPMHEELKVNVVSSKPEQPKVILVDQKQEPLVTKITSPNAVCKSYPVCTSPLPDYVDSEDDLPKPHPKNPLYIEEPEKIIKPRPKISLNKEVTFLKETRFTLNTTEKVIFSFCYSPSEFYVQRFEDGKVAEYISEQLADCDESDSWLDVYKLQPGFYCAARFEEDGCWYRAKILDIATTKASVKFIDYGNRDDVDLEYLRPLPPKLTTIPALAVCCSLKFVKPIESSWNRLASLYFEDLIDCTNGPQYNSAVIYDEIDGTYQVALVDEKTGTKINDLLIQQGYANYYEEIRKPISRMRRNPALRDAIPETKRDEPVSRINVGSEYKLNGRTEIVVEGYEKGRDGCGVERHPRITMDKPIDRPNRAVEVSPPRPVPMKELSPSEALRITSRQVTPASFYHLYRMCTPKDPESVLLYRDPEDPSIVYALGDNDIMLKLCNALGETEAQGVKIAPKAGLFAIAPADDGDYYRILVLELLNNSKCRVFYLDFGNLDEISCSEVYKLPKSIDLAAIPAQGIRCRVDNMNKIDNYENALDARVAEGTPAKIEVTRKISDHEYGINLTL